MISNKILECSSMNSPGLLITLPAKRIKPGPSGINSEFTNLGDRCPGNVYLILPNQLFEPNCDAKTVLYLYEHPLFFSAYEYNKIKLLFLREAMTTYIMTYGGKRLEHGYNMAKFYAKNSIVNVYNPINKKIKKHYKQISKDFGTRFIYHRNPIYLDLGNLGNKCFSTFTSFYIAARQHLNILCEGDSPFGGQWKYKVKTNNRWPFMPEPVYYESLTLNESRGYLLDHFNHRYGQDDPAFFYDAYSAREYFKTYCTKYLKNYGKYEHIISPEIIYGYGPNISYLLNTGLLTYDWVIKRILENTTLINIGHSELLIRRLLYANFAKVVYGQRIGLKGHLRSLPPGWWTAETSMQPFDYLIRKIWTCGFATSEERKYILIFMTMVRYNPDHIFSWFMAMFLDSEEFILKQNMEGCYKKIENSKHISSFFKHFTDHKFMKKLWDGLFYTYIDCGRTELFGTYNLAKDYAKWDKMSENKKSKIRAFVSAWRIKSKTPSQQRSQGRRGRINR